MKKGMKMDKDERKRLEDLQKDGQKGVGKYGLEKLTYPDFQLLLCEDAVIQKLIRDIVTPMFSQPGQESGTITLAPPTQERMEESDASPAVAVIAPPPVVYVDRIEYVDRVVEKIVEKEVIKVQIKEVEKRVEVPVDGPLLVALAPELKLLKAIKADSELMPLWLWANEDEGRQLVRLLAALSDWEEVLRLWSHLAERCKTAKRAAKPAELVVLNGALALHNLRYRDRAAELKTIALGEPFHHETMERGSTKGSIVTEVWLPGLTNAAGQVQKKPLVNLE